MKNMVNRIVVLLVITVLTGVAALAKTTEKKVTFRDSVTVNGTLVKKGTYKVAFNDETGELTIKKGGEVVATASARLETTGERYDFYISSASGDPTKAPTLVGISWKDGNLARLANNADAAASSKP
jgi:hypothetical protein